MGGFGEPTKGTHVLPYRIDGSSLQFLLVAFEFWNAAALRNIDPAIVVQSFKLGGCCHPMPTLTDFCGINPPQTSSGFSVAYPRACNARPPMLAASCDVF